MWQALAAAIPSIMGAAQAGGGLMAGGGGLGMGEATGGLFSMGDGGGLGMNAGFNPMDAVSGGFDMDNLGGDEEEEEIPRPPYAGPDVSGFASYGMQAPALPEMTHQRDLAGLMAMATSGDANSARDRDPFLQQNKGGLMAYLDTLGV